MNQYYTDENHDRLESTVRETIVNEKLDKVFVHTFDGVKESNYVGKEDKLYIILNATKVEDYDGVVAIPNHEKFGNVLLSDSESSRTIIVDGVKIANYYRKDRYGDTINTLNILYNPFTVNDELKSLEKVLNEFTRVINEAGEWNKGQKDTVLEDVKRFLKNNISDRKGTLENEIRSNENRIQDYKEHLTRLVSSNRVNRNQLENLGDFEKGEVNKIAKEFDLISEHDNITSLKFEDGSMIFKTVHLNFFDQNDNEYEGGEYTVNVRLTDGRTRLRSTHEVEGGWGEDISPHPHVPENGSPCFGNVTSTLAELLGDLEYYAYVITMMNYLQSVDTTDSVGKYAYMWGVKQDDGSFVVEEPDREVFYHCDECGDPIYYEDEVHYVYEEIYEDDDGEWRVDGDTESRVCENCFEEHYYYSDELGEYINHDA